MQQNRISFKKPNIQNFGSKRAALYHNKNKCAVLPERHTTLLFKLARSHSRLL
jgi:hypothetical protein